MRWIKLALLPLLLTACIQTAPSVVSTKPMRTAVESLEVTLHSDNDLKIVADTWKRNGRGPVQLVSTYRDGQEGLANYNASSAANRLRAMGVEEIEVSTLPAGSNEVIAYMRTLRADADPSCTILPTSGPTIADYNFGSYRLGCTNDELMAKQVARTEDLEGRIPGMGYTSSSDARRQGAIVDVYRTGEPNTQLKGLAASDISERAK